MKWNLVTIGACIFAASLFQNCAPKSDNEISPASAGNGPLAPTCSVTHSDGAGNLSPAFSVTVANSGAIENTVTSSVPSLQVWATGSNGGTAITPVLIGSLNALGVLTWHPCQLAGAVVCPVGTFVRSFELRDAAGVAICTTNAISVTIL